MCMCILIEVLMPYVAYALNFELSMVWAFIYTTPNRCMYSCVYMVRICTHISIYIHIYVWHVCICIFVYFWVCGYHTNMYVCASVRACLFWPNVSQQLCPDHEVQKQKPQKSVIGWWVYKQRSEQELPVHVPITGFKGAWSTVQTDTLGPWGWWQSTIHKDMQERAVLGNLGNTLLRWTIVKQTWVHGRSGNHEFGVNKTVWSTVQQHAQLHAPV